MKGQEFEYNFHKIYIDTMYMNLVKIRGKFYDKKKFHKLLTT